jgi:thioredoxin 2
VTESDVPLILPCPSCGVKNRVPAKHLTDSGRCGSCQGTLPAAAAPIDVDAALLDEIVASAGVPLLVDFWADWCGPCKAAAPHVEATAKRSAGRALVLKVDADRHPDLVDRYRVQGFPTFLVLKDGREVLRHPGYTNSAEMGRWLEEVP